MKYIVDYYNNEMGKHYYEYYNANSLKELLIYLLLNDKILENILYDYIDDLLLSLENYDPSIQQKDQYYHYEEQKIKTIYKDLLLKTNINEKENLAKNIQLDDEEMKRINNIKCKDQINNLILLLKLQKFYLENPSDFLQQLTITEMENIISIQLNADADSLKIEPYQEAQFIEI